MIKFYDFCRRRLYLLALLSTVHAGTAHASDPVYSTIPAVDCVINPYRVADIASPVAGVIENLLVTRSQQVRKGQPVAQLNADVERANVELANYRADIRSEIELGQINVSFDASRKDRFDSLYKEQVVSMDDIDAVKRESRLSRWRLEQARELARVRQLELKRAEQQLQQKTIVAPFEGFVIDTFKDAGEHVEDQAILRLAQLNPLVVEAIVPMEYFGKVEPNMLAEIVPEVLVDEKLSGRVSIVDRIGDTASNTFGVRLVLDNPYYRIPAGLKCMVKFLRQWAPVEAPVTADEEQLETAVAIDPVDAADNTAVEDTTSSAAEIPTFVEPDAQPSISTAKVSPKPVQTDANAGTAQSTSTKSDQVSYLVLTRQAETVTATEALVDRIRGAGFNDLARLNGGPFRGFISLGLFSSRELAEIHLRNLRNSGFEVFIRERS